LAEKVFLLRKISDSCYSCAAMTITASAVSLILSNALKAVNAIRERAKTSKDNDLKEHISTTYDNLLTLKEATLRLTEENSELKRQLEEKQAIVRDSISGLIYRANDESPLCPNCYQTANKQIYLDPPYHSSETEHLAIAERAERNMTIRINCVFRLCAGIQTAQMTAGMDAVGMLKA
jgi:16S rRNA G966 N2-methylase RsmD